MIESPLTTLNDESMVLRTPSKQRPATPQTIGNDENYENRISLPDEDQQQKKARTSSTPIKMALNDINPTESEDYGSDCGTETSTVSARREWLKQFGKSHENTFPTSTTKSHTERKFDSVPRAPLPPRSAVKPPTSALKPSIPVAPHSTTKVPTEPRRNFTPVRKPKTTRQETIEATNDGYASVAKLSEWLAADPTSTKKKKHVRRGRNVIARSRKFEKDLENVIVVENHITRGSVSKHKEWLQGAFHDESDNEEAASVTGSDLRYTKSDTGGCDASSISVSDKKDWLKNVFKKATDQSGEEEADEDEPRSEIITDDAASSLSVSDKKDWLKNAFKKGEGPNRPKGLPHGKAKSDVMHNRGESRDEVAARAKRRFLERSKRAAAERAASTTPTKRAPRYRPSVDGQQVRVVASEGLAHQENNEPAKRSDKEERTGPPTGSGVEPVHKLDSDVVEPNDRVEEDKTPVDFRAARELLIRRGRNNGNDMRVVNKVYMKKNKFERMEKEIRRRSGANGLLKPAWEQSVPDSGRPSDTYEKKYVSDIAPKKSFEELP